MLIKLNHKEPWQVPRRLDSPPFVPFILGDLGDLCATAIKGISSSEDAILRKSKPNRGEDLPKSSRVEGDVMSEGLGLIALKNTSTLNALRVVGMMINLEPRLEK